MASVLKVDKLDPQSGTALEIGSSGDTITIPSGATFTQSGTMNASAITAGTIATARLGTGTASSSTVLYGDNTWAAAGGGIIKQIVTATDGGNSTATHNGATWTTLETLGTTITVDKGNKVWFIATSVGWYTSGTTSYNGLVRFNITDATNSAQTNAILMQTQNFSINKTRMYGTTHAGLLTTASGSGTVAVTATAQASTEEHATANYGDVNTLTSYSYTFMEIIV